MNEIVTANQLAWDKMNGLLPAVVQHAQSGDVLMLGYMNQEAFDQTVSTREVTFFSRSKQRLWRKGETSGNSMEVQAIRTDCDHDTLLIHVLPKGPACHLGYASCFQPPVVSDLGFLQTLITLIAERAAAGADPKRYTTQLLSEGVERCAQKVGEEAVEVVIAAVGQKPNDLINETADLLFHLLVLLQACDIDFFDVIECLKKRHVPVELTSTVEVKS
ncbi:MAG: bifunctional phosphoribosyl-AMP cyclohydrolase/phosphoribosyl-ATP diphosphatase HisIE [Chthoniobacterales bacterium]